MFFYTIPYRKETVNCFLQLEKSSILVEWNELRAVTFVSLPTARFFVAFPKLTLIFNHGTKGVRVPIHEMLTKAAQNYSKATPDLCPRTASGTLRPVSQWHFQVRTCWSGITSFYTLRIETKSNQLL